MWIVAKIKSKDLNIFKENLAKKFGRDISFFAPKIRYNIRNGNKTIIREKYLLENYIFCYHENFKNSKNLIQYNFIKGLDYFLQGYNQNQKEIINFINYCKSFENEDGYISSAFFKEMLMKKAKFISGPFTNLIFEIIEKQKNKLKILIGNYVTTIPNNTNYLYRPV